MTISRQVNYKMMPVVFIITGMVIICEYILEYNYTGHYFYMPTTRWLLFSISEIIFDIILFFILYIAYKLESENSIALILSIAFGGDALFLFIGIINALFPMQLSENETDIIKDVCNMSFIYFSRHFIFIASIYIASFNYMPKTSEKYNFSLYALLIITVALFFLSICTSTIHSNKLTEHHDILLSPRSLFFLSGLWLSLCFIYLPKNHKAVMYRDIIYFFMISNITCNFLLVATESSNTITWYISRGLENVCKSAILIIIYLHVKTLLNNFIKFSHRDYLTGFLHHSIFSEEPPYFSSYLNKDNTYITIISCKIHNLDTFYINKGFTAGDNAIKNIANVFINNAGHTDTIIRIREDIFIMLTPFSSKSTLQIQYKQIKNSIIHTVKKTDTLLDVTILCQVVNLSKTPLDKVISDLTSEHQL